MTTDVPPTPRPSGSAAGCRRIRECVCTTSPIASGEVHVSFDPDALKCELTDSAGKAVAPTPVPGSGGRPGKAVVTIPYDGSIRLRANPATRVWVPS